MVSVSVVLGHLQGSFTEFGSRSQANSAPDFLASQLLAPAPRTSPALQDNSARVVRWSPSFAMKKFPIHPKNPERICWGCDTYCAVNSMACANERSPHPSELFGEDWLDWNNNLPTQYDECKACTHSAFMVHN
jgi:hypothetical protein